MTFRRPGVVLAAVAAVASAAAGLGLVGGALVADHDPVRVAAASVPTAGPPVPTTARPARPVARAPGLPVPENAPADPYAPTPDVVYGTLVLPSIGVRQPLHEGVTLTAIDRGPSHWPGTALPGQLGNVVVAGHRVSHTHPFYDLDRLRPGDPLVFTMRDGATWTYRLTSLEIVAPDATRIVTQSPAYTATLFACHPKHSARERLVAHFRLDRRTLSASGVPARS